MKKPLVIFALFFILASAFVFPYYRTTEPVKANAWWRVVLEKAPAPYSHRVLMPHTINTVAKFNGKDYLSAEGMLVGAVMLALLLLMYYLADQTLAAPLLLYAGLVATFVAGGYVSPGCMLNSPRYMQDLPAVLVALLGLWMILKFPPAYAAVVLIGTFNKETALWLLPAAAWLWTLRDGGKKAALWAGLAVAAFVAAKLVLLLTIGGWGMPPWAPGKNAWLFEEPWRIGRLMFVAGGLWLGVLLMDKKHVWLVPSLVLFAAGIVLFGSVDEMRAWGELLPVLALLIAKPEFLAAPADNTT